MELLAAELLEPEECDNAFVVGIFSLLDTMVGLPLDKVLESISLPQNVVDALLHRTGPLAPFLKLTLACEDVDDIAFAENAMALQLTDHQVNWAHLQALASTEYEKGVNEFVKAGFTQVPSTLIQPPRVGDAPVSFECKVLQVIPMGTEGGAGNLVICQVLLIHVQRG